MACDHCCAELLLGCALPFEGACLCPRCYDAAALKVSPDAVDRVTLRLAIPDPEKDVRQRAARVWLRGQQRGARRIRDVINASELIVCLSLRKPPSEAAAQWLQRRSKHGALELDAGSR